MRHVRRADWNPTKDSCRPPKFTWQKSTDLIDAYLECEEISELLTVMQAGLVPYSMAGDLGEEERKSACKNGIFTFTLEDPLLDELPENFDDDAQGWEHFFGKPGYTKVSLYIEYPDGNRMNRNSNF